MDGKEPKPIDPDDDDANTKPVEEPGEKAPDHQDQMDEDGTPG